MAQKVQFITTVLHEPELLILDEPFSGFDPINATLVRDEILRLRNEGATIILSTHNMSSVEEICDKIALINLGHKVLEGNVKDIRSSYRSLTYQLRFKGEMISFVNALWANFELIEKSSDNDEHTVSVKLGEGKTLNDLLSTVLPVCQIEEVKEQIPGMNEIFIQAVQQSTQEIKVA
jgi:ABC-2 type transport system ATP-binding protein